MVNDGDEYTLEKRSESTSDFFHISRITWIPTAIVAWGIWNAQTDVFPLNEQTLLRPSWFVYGWPICFATSGRGRFNFNSYDGVALAFDLTVSLVILACTVLAVEFVLRIDRLTIRDLFAITAGFSVPLFVWSDNVLLLLEMTLNVAPPLFDNSEIAGDSRLPSRLHLFMVIPLSWGLFCVGFGAVSLLFILGDRTNRS